jgi:NAD-dependent DNA ligase
MDLTIAPFITRTQLDKVSFSEALNVLQECDDMYHNGIESPLTDVEYDLLRNHAQKLNPEHHYFLNVGSKVRGGKVKLPYPMGSLDQVHDKELHAWAREKIIGDEFVVISEKLDGYSALLIYDNRGRLKVAYSRGNGREGADITRHVKNIHNVPQKTLPNLIVRGEILISKKNWPRVQELLRDKDNNLPKNARNSVAGLMDRESIDNKDLYSYIDFAAFEIVDDIRCNSKIDSLELLGKYFFTVVYQPIFISPDEFLTSNYLFETVKTSKKNSLYEIDGVVVEIDSYDSRNELKQTKSSLNPPWAFKYKINSKENTGVTKVKSIEWNISKHNVLIPKVLIESIVLSEVTVTAATGFNAAYIYNNRIGPGSVLQVVRSGDVIPYIVESCQCEMDEDEYYKWFYSEIEKFGDYEWDSTCVNIVLLEENDVSKLKYIESFFTELEVPGLRAASLKKLHVSGLNSIDTIIKSSRETLVDVLGVNGGKVYDALHQKLKSIDFYKLLGAHARHHGIGIDRVKSLQIQLGKDAILNCNDHTVFLECKGFQEQLAKRVLESVIEFKEFLNNINGYYTFNEEEPIENGYVSDNVYVFTGFRDPELKELLENSGAIVTSSFNKKTTHLVVLSMDKSKSKISKAKEMGINIITKKELYNSYI